MDDVVSLIEGEIPRLRRYARYLVRDVDRADDLVQDALVRAISNLDKWQRGTNLRSWLFVILRNVYINDLRKLRTSPAPAELQDDDAAVGVCGGQEARQAMVEMERAFNQLSEEHREVLLLVAVEGLEYEEASRVLDVPIGTVRSRLSRARSALRDILQPSSGVGGKEWIL
ncbi:MAG: sigma-70 family RNA polymerase sigma factor [Rhodospirillales bacterium]|nr:MAG: sigma-70 family RNA polymerase sigma factor [Rhodospirillales bacterium]